MIGTLKGLLTTFKTTVRRPVTVQYPDAHLPLQPRYMGFPVLTWDFVVQEPYCTGCLVCARICPTDCITVSMKDNPKFAEGESHRRKIVEDFRLDIANCILCGFCVEFCNFDAILMSDFHEEGSVSRAEQDLPLAMLLEMGIAEQAKGKFTPPPPKKRPAPVAAGRVSEEASSPAPEAETAEGGESEEE